MQTDEDETVSTVRTSGSQHAALWTALLAGARAVEVVVVGRDPVRLDAAGRLFDHWSATAPESVAMCRQEASAELATIRKALITSDWAALEAYGDINGALRRMSVLADAAETRGLKVANTSRRTWRSMRVPEWPPRLGRWRGCLTRRTTPAADGEQDGQPCRSSRRATSPTWGRASRWKGKRAKATGENVLGFALLHELCGYDDGAGLTRVAPGVGSLHVSVGYSR